MKNTIILIAAILGIIISSCGDDVPGDYVSAYFVEGYLIVDEPIENIILMESQPLTDSFFYENSLVSNATVKISTKDEDFLLDFRPDSAYGYYYHDKNYKVKPETEYKLLITLPDGHEITGTTITPKRFEWVKPLNEFIHYPVDTINLPSPDSLKIEWTNPYDVTQYYIIKTTCLDTLNYGIYLNPESVEFNRRTYKPHADNSRYYNDLNIYAGPLPNTKTPLIWNSLKWYGKNELSIFLPDFNFLRWFIHVQRRSSYEEILGSIEGAMGVFGSASIIKDSTFIIKNRK